MSLISQCLDNNSQIQMKCYSKESSLYKICLRKLCSTKHPWDVLVYLTYVTGVSRVVRVVPIWIQESDRGGPIFGKKKSTKDRVGYFRLQSPPHLSLFFVKVHILCLTLTQLWRPTVIYTLSRHPNSYPSLALEYCRSIHTPSPSCTPCPLDFLGVSCEISAYKQQ